MEKKSINHKNMRNLYNEVLNNIKNINFNELWKGFKRYKFALYTSDEIYFEDKKILWDERFMGNTAIKYENEYIAIWEIDYLDGNNDIDLLTAYIVHEMFHAYQYENDEKRFPEDLHLLDYPDDIDNFSLKYEENKLIAQAFLEKDLKIKRLILEKFIGTRLKRQNIIGDMCKLEYLAETAEGIAEYVGMMALKKLSEEKYSAIMIKYSLLLSEFSQLQLDIRRISYYSGTVFLMTAYDLGINFEHSISNNEKAVFEIVADIVGCKSIDNLHFDTGLAEKAAADNIERKKALISGFMESKNRIGKEGKFKITGYDPMNMLKLNNQILCKTFVKLTDWHSEEDITLMGETLIDMKHNEADEAIRYWR